MSTSSPSLPGESETFRLVKLLSEGVLSDQSENCPQLVILLQWVLYKEKSAKLQFPTAKKSTEFAKKVDKFSFKNFV